MRYSTGQSSDRLHFFRLPQAVLRVNRLGDIPYDEDRVFQNVRRGQRAVEQPATMVGPPLPRGTTPKAMSKISN